MQRAVIDIISELGEDADLVLKPDDWLENHRVSLQQKMSLIADELQAVLSAQRTKIRLSRLRQLRLPSDPI